ncbi:hypothetical protein [Billgrantia desiderata]|uniref:hypothetical protein n=1 Tax=Billgrantia desiderata TaxID=52021 RepID=UPI001F275A37|nr:hypothetical protein [Halomonas desiderata]MCE8012939.1 hypothetical protein [Halomonas desiderata]
MSEQTEIFLARFAQLEKLAAREARQDESRGLMANVRVAKERNPVIRRNASDIKLLAKLRNVLVHERDARYAPRYLAEPLPELVAQLVNIIQQIEKPARVVQHFMVSVREFEPGDSMVKVLRFLAAQEFSQTFVRIEGRLKILTANTIQRWLGHNATDELIDCTESVSNVLGYQELPDELLFAPRETTLVAALDAFDGVKHPHLAALVITEHGRENEEPLALLTPSDLGRVTQILEGKVPC